MFLEKCGKFFFLEIRPIFFFALAILPFLGASFFLSLQSKKIGELENRFISAIGKEKIALERKKRKEKFLTRYGKGNPYFLDQWIESEKLLQSEKETLEFLLRHPAVSESKQIQSRLSFLNENSLAFSEEKIEADSEMKEIVEKQRHPVQMDEKDLKRILSLIEDIPLDPSSPLEGTPHILITDFQLKKQKTALENEVFEVEMSLLKREFFQ